MRTVDELAAFPDPAGPGGGWSCLYTLVVSCGSRPAALALGMGALIVEDGWLRVLVGGGDHGLPLLTEANGLSGRESHRSVP